MSAPAPSRVALVTGGSRGIGRHLVRGLAGAGIAVAVHATTAERAEEAAAEARSAGVDAIAVGADVTDPAEVRRAVEKAEAALGPIDLLVNNAGRVDAEVPLWEADAEEWRDVLLTNVYGPFLMARAVVPGMIARGGGRVVNLNSGAGTRSMRSPTAYNASKTALFRIGGSLDAAGREQGIRTFELAPGVVDTDMTRSMRMHDGRTEWTAPEDVVALLLEIARGEADHLSGGYLRAGADNPADLAAERTLKLLEIVERPASG